MAFSASNIQTHTSERNVAFSVCQFGKSNSLARREASHAANSEKKELLFLNLFSTKYLGNFEHLQI